MTEVDHSELAEMGKIIENLQRIISEREGAWEAMAQSLGNLAEIFPQFSPEQQELLRQAFMPIHKHENGVPEAE